MRDHQGVPRAPPPMCSLSQLASVSAHHSYTRVMRRIKVRLSQVVSADFLWFFGTNVSRMSILVVNSDVEARKSQ